LKAFTCLLSQEVAYFDRSENSSGAICARLSSHASAIQSMAGTRLGALCEALALAVFGILFEFLTSWQLTLIIFGPLFLIGIIAYWDVSLRRWINTESNQSLQRATSVRLGFS